MHAYGLVFTLICNIKGRRAPHRGRGIIIRIITRNEEEENHNRTVLFRQTLENRAELFGFDFHRAQLIFIFFL